MDPMRGKYSSEIFPPTGGQGLHAIINLQRLAYMFSLSHARSTLAICKRQECREQRRSLSLRVCDMYARKIAPLSTRAGLSYGANRPFAKPPTRYSTHEERITGRHWPPLFVPRVPQCLCDKTEVTAFFTDSVIECAK